MKKKCYSCEEVLSGDDGCFMKTGVWVCYACQGEQDKIDEADLGGHTPICEHGVDVSHACIDCLHKERR